MLKSQEDSRPKAKSRYARWRRLGLVVLGIAVLEIATTQAYITAILWSSNLETAAYYGTYFNVWYVARKTVPRVYAVENAVIRHRDAVVKLLLKRPIQIDAKGEQGQESLRLASTYGSADLAKWLLDRGADVNNRDYKGRTPLWFAVFHGQLSVASVLIAGGADVNAQTDYWRTPLIAESSWCGMDGGESPAASKEEMMELLLKHGANPAIKDSRGKTIWDQDLSPEVERVLLRYAQPPDGSQSGHRR